MEPVKRANLKLFEHDADEQILGEIPRHPIGHFFIFITAILVICAVLAGLFYSIANREAVNQSLNIDSAVDTSGISTGLALVLVIVAVVGAFLASYVYENNYIVVTDQKLVFIRLKNIFTRRVSQLSIGDVQDVTIDEPSVFSRLFGYGTVNIETAGEQAHFMFPYAKKPFDASKAIVEAHENNLQKFGN